MKTWFIILLYLATAAFWKLDFVLEIARHGIRTPQALYNFTKDPKDNFKVEYELTEMGKRQHYLIGNQIRKRYIDELHLISSDFNSTEIIFRSTDTHRTIESGVSQMTGVFPPKFWSQTLTPFQQKNAVPPFDIGETKHLIDELDDKALPNCFNLAPIYAKRMENWYDISIDDADCPNYISILKELSKSETYKQLRNPFVSVLLDRLQKYLNRDVEESELDDLWEYLMMASYHKLELIFNYTEDDVKQWEMLHDVNMYKVSWGDDRLWQIGSKEFLNMIIDRMDKIVARNQTHKMEVIISHDNGINNILNGLGHLTKVTPPLATTVFFELHNENNEFYVTTIYKKY